MAGMSQEQKDAVRRQLEAQLNNQSIPEDLKQQIRAKLETLMLESDVAYADKEVEQFGAERWDDAVQRYRDLGARTRGPVQLDQAQADRARALQMGGLGLMDQAARGEAPSVAEAQGRLSATGIRGAAGQSIAGVRGNQVGASMAAGRGMGNQLVGSLGNIAMGRANEATQDRTAFSNAAGSVRGQDIGAATTNAELVAKSRAQDEARQQQFEKMGWNTRNAQLGANVELQRQTDAKRQEIAQQKAARAGQAAATAKQAASMGAGALMSMMAFSDPRTKTEIEYGALDSLKKRK